MLLVDAGAGLSNANAVAPDLFEGESAGGCWARRSPCCLPPPPRAGRAVATAGPGPAALPPLVADPERGRVPERGQAERLAARRTDGSMFPARGQHGQDAG